MPETTATDLYASLWDTIATIRDAHPRLPTDADTDEIVAAVQAVFVADLRRLAEELIREEDAHKVWRAISRRADEIERSTT